MLSYAATKRSTSSRVVDGPTETRTWPCVSTPIATRTCDGAPEVEAQEEPEWTAKPAASSSVTSASPST